MWGRLVFEDRCVSLIQAIASRVLICSLVSVFQYISGRFSTGYRATIGADFITKTLPHPTNPKETVTLQIWVRPIVSLLSLIVEV